jgi:hypothetical protein
MDEWNEETQVLATKLSDVLKREVSPFERALIDWVLTQVQLRELEEEQA